MDVFFFGKIVFG